MHSHHVVSASYCAVLILRRQIMSRHHGPFRIPCRHGRKGCGVVAKRCDGAVVGFGVGSPPFGRSAANVTFGGGGCLERGGCLAELHDGSLFD